MSDKNVLLEISDGVAKITIDNAINFLPSRQRETRRQSFWYQCSHRL